ncbi:hypothetical protein ACQP2F_08990 [Actinoplanes sp. CA-030573]|uniref:hypothetical protein n=1 Tax=Actinoplanes sp. CA-030573 TaxID=3239898 RepID=UPI003D8C9FA0
MNRFQALAFVLLVAVIVGQTGGILSAFAGTAPVRCVLYGFGVFAAAVVLGLGIVTFLFA